MFLTFFCVFHLLSLIRDLPIALPLLFLIVNFLKKNVSKNTIDFLVSNELKSEIFWFLIKILIRTILKRANLRFVAIWISPKNLVFFCYFLFCQLHLAIVESCDFFCSDCSFFLILGFDWIGSLNWTLIYGFYTT